jgi:fimbrial chaperone protein
MLLMSLAGLCLADEWSVSPLKLELGGTVKSGVFSVRNLGSVEKNFAINVRQWTQDADGKDVEADTSDLIFFPATLKVPAGDYAVVRVGARNPIAETERAYRLYVSELPLAADEAEPKGTIMRVVFRFGLPVFIQPRQKDSRLQIELREEDGGIAARVSNPGNVHVRADEVRFRGLDAQGNERFSRTLAERYLLAGATRSYRLPVPGDVCGTVSKVQLHYEVAGKTVWGAEADASGKACGNR